MTTDVTGTSDSQTKGRAHRGRPQSIVMASPATHSNGANPQLQEQAPSNFEPVEILVEERAPRQKAGRDRNHGSDRAEENLSQERQVSYREHYEAWYNHAKWLEAENKQLHVDLRNISAYQADRDKAVREVHKLTEKIGKLQAEALSSDSIDRFQSATDDEITIAFDKVKQEVGKLVTTLCLKSKAKPTLSITDWETEAMSAMHEKAFDQRFGKIDYNDTWLRRMAVKHVVWRFLDTELLGVVFGGYFGRRVEELRNAYKLLYPNPRADKDSTKWKTLSSSKLNTLQEQEDLSAGIEALCSKFGREVTARLGYNKEDEKLADKVHTVMDATAVFGRFLAQQRAIIELKFPDVVSSELIKDVADECLTNTEDDDGNSEERSGKVWFVSRPALIKWGNKVGDELDVSMILVRANVRLVE